MRATRTEASGRASVLISHMHPAPRQVCLADSNDILGRSDGVNEILEISRNYPAPAAADAIHQEVMRYMRLKRTEQSIAEYAAEYYLLRRKAEPKWKWGLDSRAGRINFAHG